MKFNKRILKFLWNNEDLGTAFAKQLERKEERHVLLHTRLLINLGLLENVGGGAGIEQQILRE